mgnify:CR=1 FL=1
MLGKMIEQRFNLSANLSRKPLIIVKVITFIPVYMRKSAGVRP